MGYADNSDPALQFAFWTGVAAVVLTFLLLIQLVVMRIFLNLREKRKTVFLQEWRNYIVESVVGTVPALPAVPRANTPFLLNLWNHYQESLRGEAKLNLQKLAMAVSMDKMALRMIKSGNIANQMLAIMTLGNMKFEPAWDLLEKKLRQRNPLVSLAAARALMQIAPAAIAEELVNLLETREDWASVRVATMLKEAGPEIISAPLTRLIKRAPVAVLPRLIPYLEFVYSNAATELIRHLLQTYQDPAVVTASLRMLDSAEDLYLVRRLARHEDWFVRVQAVAALGRLGTAEELPLILELMRDSQWWVRYRAAQALSGLPFVTSKQLQQYLQHESDMYARNMLEQVLAEKHS